MGRELLTGTQVGALLRICGLGAAQTLGDDRVCLPALNLSRAGLRSLEWDELVHSDFPENATFLTVCRRNVAEILVVVLTRTKFSHPCFQHMNINC